MFLLLPLNVPELHKEIPYNPNEIPDKHEPHNRQPPQNRNLGNLGQCTPHSIRCHMNQRDEIRNGLGSESDPHGHHLGPHPPPPPHRQTAHEQENYAQRGQKSDGVENHELTVSYRYPISHHRLTRLVLLAWVDLVPIWVNLVVVLPDPAWRGQAGLEGRGG